MWEVVSLRPLGRLSMRNLFACAIAGLVTAILAVLFLAPSAHAADITWQGSEIIYQGTTFRGPQTVTQSDVDQGLQIALGSIYYVNYSTNPGGWQDAKFIYFAPGTDPPRETTAQFVSYRAISIGNGFTNPSTPVALTATPQGAAASASGTTSCAIDGIGWIVCPIANFMAKGTDWVFDKIMDFMTVKPLDLGTSTPLYRAWSVMQTFANVAFVIAFLIIIYSQVTSLGLNSYGIKKLLPRLIIAAILVNISYYICAIAVDISNILGSSLQDIFVNIRQNLLAPGQSNPFDANSWQNLTAYILSGGTVAAIGIVGGIAALGAAGGTAAGMIFLLLPALVTVLVAVLVAFAVLAARQALIIVLIVIAPLAFVAYLLPNTEKWFDKWRDLFMTMLMLFPIFSVLFGGSQLAGFLILQNADNFNTLLLGMFVMLIPLAITPFLLKFSGALLSRFAGVINNPNKGIVDRTRKFSQDRLADKKQQGMANPTNPFRRFAANKDFKRREREGWRKVHEAQNEGRWAGDHRAHTIHSAIKDAELNKQIAEAASEQQWLGTRDPIVVEKKLRLKVETDKAELLKKMEQNDYEELKTVARSTSSTHAMGTLVREAHDTAEALAIQGMRGQAATNVQHQDLARSLEASTAAGQALRAQAGGIDPNGALRAQARAVGDITKADEEAVGLGVQLLNHRALQQGTTLKNLSATIVNDAIAGGGAVHGQAVIEAALEAQAKEGNISIFEAARGSVNVDQDALSSVIARNAGTFKGKGGFHLQADPQLSILADPVNFTVKMNTARLGTLADTSAEGIKDLKYGWVVDIANRLKNDTDGIRSTAFADPAMKATLQKVYDNVKEALENDDIRSALDTRVSNVQDIEELFRNNGFTPSPNTKP